MALLLFVIVTIFLPVFSLHEDAPTLEERIGNLPPDDQLILQLMRDDQVYWFAELCGNRIPNNSRGIVRSLQEHPENASRFETFAQNTVYIGQLLLQRG